MTTLMQKFRDLDEAERELQKWRHRTTMMTVSMIVLLAIAISALLIGIARASGSNYDWVGRYPRSNMVEQSPCDEGHRALYNEIDRLRRELEKRR